MDDPYDHFVTEMTLDRVVLASHLYDTLFGNAIWTFKALLCILGSRRGKIVNSLKRDMATTL